ncbi:MAG: phosphate ABC transporter permease subunit PstC, partial [Firmicutes bacterium]|nr:phosphate ABC transporter permease subunit PstC [Bacillota bacterium]
MSKAVDRAMQGVFLVCGLITIACVFVITIYLIISGLPAIREIGIVEFLFGKVWASTAEEPAYGILPFI